MKISLDIKKLVPRAYQALVYPTIFIVGIAILLFISIKIGTSQIKQVREELSKLSKDVSTLTQKEASLKGVQSSVSGDAESAISAVPSQNPLLVVISQVKNLASEKGLAMTNLQAGSSSIQETGLSSGDIKFEVIGDASGVFDFIKEVASAAPLTTIEKISFSQAAGASQVTVNLKTYWAKLPETIPSATEPLSGLTADEQKTLAKIQGLVPPPYGNLTPEAPKERGNPFSF